MNCVLPSSCRCSIKLHLIWLELRKCLPSNTVEMKAKPSDNEIVAKLLDMVWALQCVPPSAVFYSSDASQSQHMWTFRFHFVIILRTRIYTMLYIFVFSCGEQENASYKARKRKWKINRPICRTIECDVEEESKKSKEAQQQNNCQRRQSSVPALRLYVKDKAQLLIECSIMTLPSRKSVLEDRSLRSSLHIIYERASVSRWLISAKQSSPLLWLNFNRNHSLPRTVRACPGSRCLISLERAQTNATGTRVLKRHREAPLE